MKETIRVLRNEGYSDDKIAEILDITISKLIQIAGPRY